MEHIIINTQIGDKTNLTVDASALLGIAGDQREAAHTLPVETEVLGERLTQHDGVAVGDKLANGIGIGFCVASGETLSKTLQLERINQH